MKVFSTSMLVLNRKTKELIRVEVLKVRAISFKQAQRILDENDFNYLTLGDEIIEEIPCLEGTFIPDYANKINYQLISNN